MAEEFKFIHASDFHLDQPISGLVELPNHIKSTIANAPYQAAERVFDLAITEKVDFVLLSGDLFDLDQGGCRPSAFLLSQFERLNEKGIEIYWCGGETDHPDRWPTAVDLPENVTTFTTPVVEEAFHQRRGTTLATIVASGVDIQRRNNADFLVESSATFPIGLSYGRFEINAMSAKPIRYWALGGQHRHQILDNTTHLIVSAGSPQGRSPAESGPHGCYLIRVDNKGAMHPHFVETDRVRWLPQKIAIAESTDLEQLKNIVGERALKLANDHSEMMLLVDWQFIASGVFNPQLRRPEQTENLREWIRKEFGMGQTGIWTNTVSFDSPANLPDGWYEEDTILGDYLRAVGRYEGDESMNLALHEYLPKHVDADEAGTFVRVSEQHRKMILEAAKLCGINYLAANRDWEDAEASSSTS
ncbi:MAG: DNA repair exonuclease [Pirellulaceae bacterium]